MSNLTPLAFHIFPASIDTANGDNFDSFNEKKAKIFKLLELGADVNSKIKSSANGVNAEMPISFAFLNFFNRNLINEEEFKQLLNYGLDAELTDLESNTLLIEAAKSRNIKAMEIILDHGANPEAVNAEGQTAFDYISDPDKEHLARIQSEKKRELGALLQPLIDGNISEVPEDIVNELVTNLIA